MRAYVIKRLALVPVVAFLVASLVFLFVRLLPGDVIAALTSEAPQYGGADELRAELGLDQSLPEQYVSFFTNTLRGDFGNSLYFQKPVRNDLQQAIPVTVELALLTVLLSVAIAVPLGVLTATHHNGPLDVVVRAVGVLFQAVPSFWIATLALTFLAIWFAWTPPLRYTPIWEDPIRNLQQFAVPTVVLAIGSLGLKLRLVRAQMLETLSEDYIRTARAKGLPGGRVVRIHALRNAMIPVVAIIGNQTGALLGGATIMENVFNLPGLGRLLIEGVNHRDYPTIQAVTLITALLLVLVNLATDIIYARLDPRIHYA